MPFLRKFRRGTFFLEKFRGGETFFGKKLGGGNFFWEKFRGGSIFGKNLGVGETFEREKCSPRRINIGCSLSMYILPDVHLKYVNSL